MTKATRFDFEKVTAIKTEYLPEAAGEGDYGFKATKLSDAGDRNLRFCITVSAELVDDLRAIATGEKNPNLRPARPDPDPLARARKGEFGPLIRYVKNGGELTDKHRHMIAMIMNQIDPPPLKWSDLRYVFDIKEDCNGKEAIQA
jgi:hypothetical protein